MKAIAKAESVKASTTGVLEPGRRVETPVSELPVAIDVSRVLGTASPSEGLGSRTGR